MGNYKKLVLKLKYLKYEKNIVIVGENMFVPTCIFALFYCLFYQYVANFPCVFLSG